MKLGARILKTGLAVILALFLCELLQLPTPVFAAISAVFAIQPSIYRSYQTIIDQIQGNVIGAVLAIIFVLLFGNHYLIVGLAAIILIMINLKLKNEKTISLSVVTLIVIMESSGDQFIEFAILRFATIMLGIFSAFLINLILHPPKYETRLYETVSKISNEIIKWIRVSRHQAADQLLLKNEIKSLKNQQIQLDQIYIFYKEERTIFRKEKHEKLRKLVLFRQMIAASKIALDLLKKLNKFDNKLASLPPETEEKLFAKIDALITNHEHLLLRYVGKAIQIHENEMKEYKDNRQHLFMLYREYEEKAKDVADPYVLQIVSTLMDYNAQLEHLEVLMNSYKSK